MTVTITRDDVRRLVREGAQLVEVLERSAYERAHLPEAIHIHLSRLDRSARDRLEPARPVVVYCADGL
jgi:rhodanese-related sulfurtransferase